LERLGHVIGMEQTQTAKKIFWKYWRLRWLEDVENGLVGFKLKKWKEKANNKEQWASVVKMTKDRRVLM
jgi:hypothetical protein